MTAPVVSHAMFDAAVLLMIVVPILTLAVYARFEAWRKKRRDTPPWWM